MTAMISKISGYLMSFAEWWMSELSAAYSSFSKKMNNEKLYISIKKDKSIAVNGFTKGGVLHEQEVVVDDVHFLRKKVLLPLSANKNLVQLISCEFSKYFPIDVDQVVFGYNSTASGDKEFIEVNVYALPKEIVNKVISAVAVKSGSSIRSMILVDEMHQSRIFYKNNEHRNSAGINNLRQKVIIACISITAILITPALKINHDISRLNKDIQEMRVLLKNEIEYEHEMKQAEQRIRKIFQDKSESGSAINIISKITDAVYGNGLLTRARVNKGWVEIEGNALNVDALKTKLKSLSDKGEMEFKLVSTRLKRPAFMVKLRYE